MAKYQNVNPLTKVHEDEPWFFIRAQDKLSVEAVMAYSQLLNKASNRSIANGDIVTGELRSRTRCSTGRKRIPIS